MWSFHSKHVPKPWCARLALAVGATAALLLGAPSVASAVPYNVSHQFRLQPGGTVVPQVFHHFNNFAQVQENGVAVDTETSPPPPSPVAIVGAGPSLITDRAEGVRTRSFAKANSRAQLAAPPAAGQALRGTVSAFGETVATLGPGVSSASTRAASASQVEARGGRPLGRGQIQWKPVFSSVAAGGPGLFVDPVFFEVVELSTGNLLAEGELLSIFGGVNGPGSQIVWDDTGLVSVTATEATLTIDISSAFTAQQGTLQLEVGGGLVTLAEDSGLFDGLLPAIGSPGNFSFQASGPDGILLDYDTGFFAETDDGTVRISLNFANGGEANDAVAAVPEPSSLAGLAVGLLALAAVARSRRRAG